MGTGEPRRALLLVALAAVLANASWFSATAVVPFEPRAPSATVAVVLVVVGVDSAAPATSTLTAPATMPPANITR